MGKRKHYKMGLTSKVNVPTCLASKILKLIRILDECQNPVSIIDLLIGIATFIKNRDEEFRIKKDL